MSKKKLMCVGAIASVIAISAVAWLCWPSSENVYSLNAYAGGWISGPSWHVGSPPHWLGFSQYTDVGMIVPLGATSNPSPKPRPCPTYTDLDFGPHHWTLKTRASTVLHSALFGLSTLTVTALLATKLNIPPG